MLSEETRRQLHLAGVRRDFIPCRVCTKCHQAAGAVQSEHPLDKQIRKIRKRLSEPINQNNQQLKSKRHWLETLRHRTSRCCGEFYEAILVDPQNALWLRWQNRWNEVRQIVFPLVYRSNPGVSDAEAMAMALKFMRREYGPLASARDDDFIVLSHIWGRGDRRVKLYIRIFRREEQLQVLQQPAPAPSSVGTAICETGI